MDQVAEQALPYWVRITQALGPTIAGVATAMIAIAVAVVAFRQWRTAHEKILLDLFDRRFTVFNETVEFQRFCTHSSWDKIEMHELGPFHEVRRRAQFLFPESVQRYLKDLHDTAIDALQASGSANGKWGEEDPIIRRESRERLVVKVKHLVGLGVTLGDTFKPFMAMHQRLR